MDLKAKCKGKTKKLNHKKISNFEELKAMIKKSFPDAPEDFGLFYH